MRALAAIVILLAGCSGAPEPVASDTAADTTSRAAADSTTVAPPLPQGSNITFDLATLDYDDSLHRYRVVAEADLTLRFEAAMAMGMYANRDDCAAAAVTAEGANAVLASWAYHNMVRTRVVAAGSDLVVEPVPEDASGQIPNEGGFGGELYFAAGQHLLVEIGGHSPRYAASHHHDPSTYERVPNRFTVTVEADGPVRVERLPDAPIRCGVGPGQAEGVQAGAVAMTSSVAVGGAIRLDSAEASTMYVDDAAGLVDDAYTLRFHDETATQTPFARAAPAGGNMAIEFEYDVEPLPEMAWLMADAYWPVLDSATAAPGAP